LLSFGLLDSGGHLPFTTLVLHADNREEGLIDRCDLVFLAKAKDGDYHQEMNGPTFLTWFENQLMPALKRPSVIVLDNASYHNISTFYLFLKGSLGHQNHQLVTTCSQWDDSD
jgi:hypothetical protein